MSDSGGHPCGTRSALEADGGATAVDCESLRRAEAAVESREADGAPTVLHVDDEPRMGPLVAEFIRQADDEADVLTETEAERALQRVEAGDVDCLVTDVEMPGMNGVDLVRAMAANHQEVPVVLFTGREWDELAGDLPPDSVVAHVHKGTSDGQFRAVADAVSAALG